MPNSRGVRRSTRAVGIDTIDGSTIARHFLWRAVGVEIVLHRTDPEGAVRTDAALIEPIVRQVRLNDGKGAKVVVVVPQADPVSKADDGSAVRAQPNRGREVGRGPHFVSAVAKEKAVDALSADVDPKQGASPVVVDGALPNDVRRCK